MRAEPSRVSLPIYLFWKQYLYDVYKSFEKCTLEWKCQAITYETINLFSVYPRIAAHVYQRTRGANNFCLEHVRVCIHGPASTSTSTHTYTPSVSHTNTQTATAARNRQIFHSVPHHRASNAKLMVNSRVVKTKTKFPYRVARVHRHTMCPVPTQSHTAVISRPNRYTTDGTSHGESKTERIKHHYP